MRILKTLTATVLTVGLATSVMAQTAAPASRLSVVSSVNKTQVVRAGAKMSKESSAGGNSIVIGLGVLAIVAGGIFLLSDDDKKPASP